jgi:hypothetical protein
MVASQGKVLGTETFTNLPDFGTCCAVETKLAPSSKLELKSGQTYWLYPLPADTTSYLVWNFDTTSLGGNGAVSTDGGSTWTPTTFNPFGAFDFYGKTIGN